MNIGDNIRGRDLTVPIGTTMQYAGQGWTREIDGWHRDDGREHQMRPRDVRLEGTVSEMVPFVETLALHKQRFAVTTLTMGHVSGGGGYLSGAENILDRLSLPNPESEMLGIGSTVSSMVNVRQCPAGTLLLSGAADRATGHSLHVYEHGLRHLSGPRQHGDRLLLRVVALPEGYDARVWPDPSDDEEEQIRLFRIAAWDAGYEEKQDRSWCEEFEGAISVLGLSHDVANALRRQGPGAVTTGPAFAPGVSVSQAQQYESAPGAVFGWHRGDGDNHYLWARTTDGEGRNRTGQMIGLTTHPDRVDFMTCESNRHVTVVWDGVSPIHEAHVCDYWEMEHMPVGTVVGQFWDGTAFAATWHKTWPNHWEPLTGGGLRGASSEFTLGALRYAYIPVPGVPRPDWAPAVPVTADNLVDAEF